MLFSDTYRIPAAEGETLYKSKGSRFIAFGFPVQNEQHIKEQLQKLRERYPDATHHCYAWILGAAGQNHRFSDDGEPSGTAGRPIYRQIQKAELTNILVVVVRYFGGTLLGVPGLIEAYGAAAEECLKLLPVEEKRIHELYRVSCPYGMENEIYRMLRQYEGSISVVNDEACFCAEIKIPLQKADAFKTRIGGMYRVEIAYIGVE